MKNLKYFQEKIKEKRKKTPLKDFLCEVPSWCISNFYKNNGLISRYPNTPRSPKLIHTKEFYKIRDSLTNYGFEYDFGRSLFENFEKLYKKVPISPTILQMAGENTDFSDTVVSASNCYLSNIIVEDCHNIFYSFQVVNNCKDIFSSIRVFNYSELVYFSSMVYESMKIFYSKSIIGSNNIWFSTNLRGCSECIFCNDLENKNYCINNQEYSKEEYKKQKNEVLKEKTKFLEYFKKLKDKGENIASKNVFGKYILRSENIENGLVVNNAINCRNIIFCGMSEDFYDTFDCGLESKDFYGVCGSGTYSNNIYCSTQVETCYNMYYCFYCNNCNNCLACIGLQNKSYCILNKEYSKEEWENLANKIFSQMEEQNILGNFFPGKLNPFYFNDTIAMMVGKFTKEEIISKGYMWREGEIKVDIPEGAELINREKLNTFQGYDENGVWKINPLILKKVIKDEIGNYYKIVKYEYDFLEKYNLPLPELHWQDRMKLHFMI